MSKNIRPVGCFKSGHETKGQSKTRPAGSEKGVLSKGGKKVSFSFVSEVNGNKILVGTNRTMLLEMTDEQKQELKRQKSHGYSEDYLDARSDLVGERTPLIKSKKEVSLKMRKSPAGRVDRERVEKPYFNQRIYHILLKTNDPRSGKPLSATKARSMASNKTFCVKFDESIKRNREYF